LDDVEFNSFLGLLIFAGVFRSGFESVDELWSPDGRPIFKATMSLKRFKQILRFIRFDNQATRATRQATDKLAAFRDIFEMFLANLPLMYRPGFDVTIDERLVATRAVVPFDSIFHQSQESMVLKYFGVVMLKLRIRLQPTFIWASNLVPLDQPETSVGTLSSALCDHYSTLVET